MIGRGPSVERPHPQCRQVSSVRTRGGPGAGTGPGPGASTLQPWCRGWAPGVGLWAREVRKPEASGRRPWAGGLGPEASGWRCKLALATRRHAHAAHVIDCEGGADEAAS